METKPKRRRNLTLLPKGFTLDPTLDSSRVHPGFEEKHAQGVAAIEKYGLLEKHGGDGEPIRRKQ